MRVKTVYVKDKQRLNLSRFPNFSVTGITCSLWQLDL